MLNALGSGDQMGKKSLSERRSPACLSVWRGKR